MFATPLKCSWTVALAAVVVLLLAACGGEADPGPEEQTQKDLRVAALFPGPVTDADYNALGFVGLEAVEEEFGVETAYSEQVPVPDVERAMREYINDDFNVIWTHGGQFFEQTVTLAEEFPDVSFIGEFDERPEEIADNLWVIDRRFHLGFYPIGALAAKASETGRIGYIGGLSLPFSYAEVHAMEQAISDLGIEAEVVPVWTGDFNDPTKARQLTNQLITRNVDFVVGSLNLGMVGVFEAVKGEPADQTWVTAKYTDKSKSAPDNYVTSVIYDFEGPLKDVIGGIIDGETSGYYPLGFDTGVAIQELQNVPEDLNEEIQQIVSSIESGEIEVKVDTTPIK